MKSGDADPLRIRILDGESPVRLELEGRMESDRSGAFAGALARLPAGAPVLLDIHRASKFGSVAVSALHDMVRQLEARGHRVALSTGNPAHRRLIKAYGRSIPPPPSPGDRGDILDRLGDRTLDMRDSSTSAALILASSLRHAFLRPWNRFDLTLQAIVRMGVGAVPLVALITFLIGAILALQSGLLLRLYGQEMRIADLVGLSMAKEIAPLLVAILVAGRSGSSLTAEVGTMMVSEEVDALKVMGVDTIEYLIAPRMRALAIALPVLTIIGDVVGIAGGLVVAQTTFSVGARTYIDQVVFQVTTGHVLGGLLKAFAFAVVIVTVAAHQGFATGGGASGVGKRTTRSVVLAILWVIIVDAFFTAVLSAMEWKP